MKGKKNRTWDVRFWYLIVGGAIQKDNARYIGILSTSDLPHNGTQRYSLVIYLSFYLRRFALACIEIADSIISSHSLSNKKRLLQKN